MTGTDTLEIEITNIDTNGFWLYVREKEKKYFLPYSEYPWFKQAKIDEILEIKLLSKSHIYWPKLDIDLDIDILSSIEKYPLVYE